MDKELKRRFKAAGVSKESKQQGWTKNQSGALKQRGWAKNQSSKGGQRIKATGMGKVLKHCIKLFLVYYALITYSLYVKLAFPLYLPYLITYIISVL